ncbi:MAG: HYR domain-containing protein [Acidobacteria bacterium]|nr:HYR domain-containing protein [Acidobacteriota bacterium]
MLLADGKVCITLTTGGAGATNHSYDFGVNAITLACPPNQTAAAAAGQSTVVVNYPAPTVKPTGTPFTCTPASGSAFPVGVTTVTCTAGSGATAVSCSFTVTVTSPTPTAKCDTLCYRSAGYWLLNLDKLPNGTVVIYGVNNNSGISTNKFRSIQSALQGNAFGAPLNARQKFNREYVAAQLNILHYGGPGAPTVFNTMWANLSCYQIDFAPITLATGAVLTRDSMVKELYMHITAAIQSRNDADLAKLTTVLELLNGTNLLGFCN